jgi:hypothetical protein
VTKVCEILSKNELSFSTGGKGDLSLFLDDINSITEKLFVNFNHILTKDEYLKSVFPLHNSINNLRNKIQPIAGQFGNDILNKLRKLIQR